MPIYEFMCNKCSKEFEALILSENEPVPSCPECRGDDVSKLLSAGSFRPHGIPSGSGGFKPPACASSGGSGGG